MLVAGTLVMRDVDANGKVDRVLATFSETLEPSSDTAPWTLSNVPRAGSLASVSTSGATATLVIAEGAGAQNTAVGTFRVVLAASATGIRDAAGNQASFGSTAPVDQATPVLVSLVMQDVNTNGKVDRVLATFSESLAAYSAGTAPWTLPQRALGRKPELGLGRRGRSRRSRSPRVRVLPTQLSGPSRSRLRALRPASATQRATSPPLRPRHRRTRHGRCSSRARW